MYNELTTKNDQNIQINRQLDVITREIAQIAQQQYPFNPQCHACLRQPWKIRERNLLSQKESLLTQLNDPVDVLQLDQIKQQIDALTKWISDYKKLQQYQPEYIAMEHNWGVYDSKNTQLQSLREEKTHLQTQIDENKQKVRSLRNEQKRNESTKDAIQKNIDNLSYVINKSPQWIIMRQKIQNIVQYQKDMILHKKYQKYLDLNHTYYHQQKWEDHYPSNTE